MYTVGTSRFVHPSQGRRGRMAVVALLVLLGLLATGPAAIPAQAAIPVPTLLSADFDVDDSGFFYQDDVFGTSQPNYASGSYQATGGYGGSGGLQVQLAGVDANAISGMSGGWGYTLNLAAAETGVSLSFRYRVQQSATYEYDEYSQVRVSVDGALHGRGSKSYVDQIGGDGSSSQGNSSSYLPTSDWQQYEIYVGDLAAGDHTLVLGGYNNGKNASDETTTVVIDDVLVTSGNAAPGASDAQALVNRLSVSQFKAYNQGVAQFNDRCRMSGCSSTDYYNALTWVEQTLQGLGYSTVRHDFNYNGSTGTNLWATKVGSVTPTQMYMVSGHLDGRGGGNAYDDDGSGVALVLEMARVLAGSDVQTDKSVRFLFWDKEEVGLYGSYGYVQDRRALQGTVDEPTWLGVIQHDMILYDHGAGTAGATQSAYADLDVEWRAGTTKEADSKALALKWRYLSGTYASDYPANAYNYSTNTDDTPFHPYVASVSVRENRRSLESGSNAEWINPYNHKTTDVETSYSSLDTLLGFNAAQASLGLVAELAGAQVVAANHPPVPNAQSAATNRNTPLEITLTASDQDGDPLTYRVTSGPSNGALSGTAPNLTYTPAAGFAGPDSFNFVANDGTVDSPEATISISVLTGNRAPVAKPQSIHTTQNTPAAVTLTGSDQDGDPLTFRVISGPANGALSGTAPNLTYTPAGDYVGPDSLDFVANDGVVDSAPATVSILVQGSTLALPFFDDFETDLGWVVNAGGTDTATSGHWKRANPQATDANGPKQLDNTVSGFYGLVTGPLAGANANSHDVDGGVTTVRSPAVQLPSGEDITLSLSYCFAHSNNSSSADYFRVRVLGGTTATLLNLVGKKADVDASWASRSLSLNSFAGQTVYIQLEAADFGPASVLEASVDDLSITAAAGPASLLSATFDNDVQGFGFADDPFRDTGQPAYAQGAYEPSDGFRGGGLQVSWGGVDNRLAYGMSGGWQGTFSLPEPDSVSISFWYNLTQSPDYEGDEFSQVLVAVDGVLYGADGEDYVAQVTGNGNGGIADSTGWRMVQVDTAELAVGEHSLTIGGYNNKKGAGNEHGGVRIDEVVVVAR